ncbi:hypothetical protein C9J01_13695 [Photobacterium rosenbergii]|uniref:Uncharacterized protein n=1 Tax=Photobacterium rosenbergii TaxID=294936 RepID=A0A2T3NDG6_9GAMM|nr:hypothetical protein C9J01_13695 [Photobacterium rosenbergii]
MEKTEKTQLPRGLRRFFEQDHKQIKSIKINNLCEILILKNIFLNLIKISFTNKNPLWVWSNQDQLHMIKPSPYEKIFSKQHITTTDKRVN